MEDFSRCYPVPPLPPVAPNPSSYDATIHQLSTNCWAHYENSNNSRHHHHSLYVGSLGPCAYVRYRHSQHLSWTNNDQKEQKRQLLQDASRAVENVLESASVGKRMRVTLLEGERVGALALSVAIHYSLQEDCDGESTLLKVSRAKKELLDIGPRYVVTLPDDECEVLYGRAGYLHAIAFVRSETNDKEYGKAIVQKIVKHIVKQGEKVAQSSGVDLPLLWTWHDSAYLGAIHGVLGILFTLLCFREEVLLVEGALEKIKSTAANLDEFCSASGNIRPSLGSERDRLVHLCHGAPGHILFLVKAYETFHEEQYLERAEEIAHNVICRRGLLKKGVGLCHGISGSAYCFLALYRARKNLEQRSGDASSSSSSSKCNEWLRWAHHFAAYGVDNLNDLFWTPDRPYSLYEGVSGLIMLLHDLRAPDQSQFPCFEHRL